MQIKTISDFRRAMRNGPRTFPGMYPVYFIMSDGEAIAFKTAKQPDVLRLMLESLRDNEEMGWRPIGLEVNWEDTDLYDAHTGEKIESAYGDD